MKRTERAYWAGIVDGEGYIGIYPIMGRWKDKIYKHYRAVIKVASTDQQIITDIQKAFGGHITFRKGTDNHKDSWQWAIAHKKNVRQMLNLIYPYLRIKKKQADIMFKYIDIKWQEIRPSFSQYRQDKYNLMVKLYEELKKLNHRGKSPAETK